jgi:hypothetical protein
MDSIADVERRAGADFSLLLGRFRRRRRGHVVMHVVMMVMHHVVMMMMVHRLLSGHWLAARRRGAGRRGAGRRGLLGDCISREAEAENGGGDKALDHGEVLSCF